jgi:hypothetical protein
VSNGGNLFCKTLHDVLLEMKITMIKLWPKVTSHHYRHQEKILCVWLEQVFILALDRLRAVAPIDIGSCKLV